ncbi:cyclic nucleotide-binding domain-containing protein [bacterium]|nr:cyclic nucleotide-binding domain-containing protein [bacterium]
MPLNINQYYNINNAGAEGVRLAASLLQSYPVTRACLGILGRSLLHQVEFGFFNQHRDIIVQGEKGKDLFLLCDEQVDVLVDGKRVVQMDAPALFGDKGIVEPESKRAATIRVAEDTTCFFIKIPMGLFIRNFDDVSIPDSQFSQEAGIFYNMFKGIQNRLFEYAFIQKNLWEEINTTLKLTNTQQIIKSLDNRIDLGWDVKIWNSIRVHLKRELGYEWPSGVPLDITTFRNLMRQHLDERFPRESFNGEDADYIKKKHQIWRRYLTSTAKLISMQIPEYKLPVSISEIQLFNPRNYQIRMQGLIKAIEKRFLANKKRKSTGESSSNNNNLDPGIMSFFGRSEKNNTFDLKSYLSSFENKFDLKYPQKMQTQIAQRTALVAAKCENEFNKSVAAMKSFIEKNQSEQSKSYLVKESEFDDEFMVEEDIIPISRAIAAYNKQLKDPVGRIGQICYQHGSRPNIMQLLRTCTSKQAKIEVDRAFHVILKKLGIPARLLDMPFITRHFFFCEATPGFAIPNDELEKHYWMPLSRGVSLYAANFKFGVIPPGRLIGGKGWVQQARDGISNEIGPWKIMIPDRRPEDPVSFSHVILVFPSNLFPWETIPDPDKETFGLLHLPAMQWLINKKIEHIVSLIPIRDEVYQNCIKTEQVTRLEKKVKAFENTKLHITPREHKKIVDFVENVVGFTPDRNKPLESDLLSKQIYNRILKQMTADYAEIPIEHLGNKTYTKWRLILSEIIHLMEQTDIEQSAISANPIFDIIETELISILKTFSIPKAAKYVQLTGQTPYIQFPAIINLLQDAEQDVNLLFQLIQSTLESYLRLLFEEIRYYKDKYEEAYTSRPQTDVESLQVNIIIETAEKLKQVINQKRAKIS